MTMEFYKHEYPTWVKLDPKIESNWNACWLTLENHGIWMASVAFPADGPRFALSAGDGRLKIWDINLGDCVTIFEGHNEVVTSIAVSANGKQVASG
jgi:WD40 repeat protein